MPFAPTNLRIVNRSGKPDGDHGVEDAATSIHTSVLAQAECLWLSFRENMDIVFLTIADRHLR